MEVLLVKDAGRKRGCRSLCLASNCPLFSCDSCFSWSTSAARDFRHWSPIPNRGVSRSRYTHGLTNKRFGPGGGWLMKIGRIVARRFPI